jgi:hypothetical protein
MEAKNYPIYTINYNPTIGNLADEIGTLISHQLLQDTIENPNKISDDLYAKYNLEKPNSPHGYYKFMIEDEALFPEIQSLWAPISEYKDEL